ncbi:MAG: 5'-3' exonuclease, partial [Lachnospiraceae bacterium]
MKKFLIIDGSSMLSTSYYGNLPKSVLYAKTDEEKEKHYSEILQTSKGVYTNALFTMLRTLIALYKKARPDYVAVAFDVSRDTFRRTVLGAESYKANRREAPAPLREQFIAMEDLLQKAGCQVLMDKDYEADDFAASLVRKFESPELETYLLTKDHDYFQLVSDHTRLWRVTDKEKVRDMQQRYGLYAGRNGYTPLPAGIFEYTADIVYSEEGVYPEDIVTLLSITGDPGDGIPGCRGVSSAAAPLVNEYGSLDAIYAAIEDCEGNKKKEKALSDFWKNSLGIGRSPLNALKENKETVYLSYQLARMKDDIPITQSLEDFKLQIGQTVRKEGRREYEMGSVIGD